MATKDLEKAARGAGECRGQAEEGGLEAGALARFETSGKKLAGDARNVKKTLAAEDDWEEGPMGKMTDAFTSQRQKALSACSAQAAALES